MSNSDQYAQQLRLSNVLREPALRAAVQALQLPAGSRGLDAGCGIGLHTVLLAQAVGPGGHVTGLDMLPDFLPLAEDYAAQHSLSDRITFRQGDVNRLPFDDDTFDWVWCADVLHPNPADGTLPALDEFVRVVRPGGKVVLLYWSSQKLLPGYPLLEARLDAAFAEAAPYTQGVRRPELHLLCALGWLQQAGLANLSAQTFIADLHAPLDETIRSALTMTFQMFWSSLRARVSAGDWAEFEQLCRVDSPDFILNRPDYYAFLTYSMFQGTVIQ